MDRSTQGILEVARSVLAELDIEVVLDRVLRAAQELTEARYAALGVLNESKTELVRFLTRGVDEATHAAIGALPRGRGVLGALIEDPVPLRVADVTEHPRSYGFPHGHPPMSTFLGVPILVGGTSFGNLYLTEKADGEQFTDADEQALVVLADFAGVAIDHASRYTGASEHRDELQRTVDALEATTQIARAVGGETDPEVVLELVAKRGRALVSARALVIELERGAELEVAAGAGELPAGIVGHRVALSDTVAAHAIRTNQVQRLEDELNRARFDEHGIGRLGVASKGGLVVPLVFRGRSYGVLVALDRLDDGPSFSAEDERLLQSFATSAATAVATAQSVATERQRQRLAAAESERQRWARELHDDTLQSLSALRFGLSAAKRTDRDGELKEAVGQAVEQIEEAIANLRALITDLRPAALDELGLQAALEALAERTGRHGIAVDVSVELARERGLPPTRLAGDLETALYRIVQEALTNAHKHGEARRAVVEIHEDDICVHVLVRDDGKGFDPTAKTDGFGLLGMRERTAILGGELDVDSTPAGGTVVRARIPTLRREAAAGPAAATA
ncbi:MAG TPA: GAF domain-containing sensor histidine kinase [Solirubrobacteraceae bacterium]|jgi:signal transduction histidine kinase|nr:GAF domain-containing sensor histidine kinase [Solirubrobacteraceae bacterium]